MPSLANQVLPELHMSQIKHTFSDSQGHVFEPSDFHLLRADMWTLKPHQTEEI